ncbi:DNA-binding protein [Methanobacterium sp. CWC-01]|uniref:OB-fold nucleic acid binding domain-containing protein n=1 Tax=Methanobacterium aridiramus TaxID=2584467 RepID=UPI0025749D40|nr:OB-fold nucleic acid binding domain-containing protein [Methanobacterium sp. CWC-01]WJI09365.1 DNA-binding protein [Methanobacterium sp. CWC-01]
MDDEKIFKIALLTSLVGMVGMIFTAGYIAPQKVRIEDLNLGMIDKEVSVEGVVQVVKRSKNGETYFLDLNDGSGRLTIVIFQSTSLDMEKNNINIMGLNQRRVNVVGNVAEYRGALELILKDSKSLKILA